MKKTYIQPATDMTVVAMQQMICLSKSVGDSAGSNTTDDVNDLLSRQSNFSVWGEEEEEY